MKNLLITIAAAVFSFTALSQEHQTPYEKKGSELVKKASKKIRSYNSLKIHFTYIMENNEMDIKDSMQGVLYNKGKMYFMEVGGNVFISDGETIWNYIYEMDEVQINYADDIDGQLTPTAILEDFTKHFRATFIRQDVHNGKRVDIIDLVPDVSQAFFKYRLALDPQSHIIVYSIAYDRHGGTFTYDIDNIEKNPTISDEKFSFNKDDFPGAYINDLR